MFTLTTATPARKLFDRLFATGYRAGWPAHIRPETRRIDKAACRCARCPDCRRHGLHCVPLTNGAGRYRVVGFCPACKSGTEL